MKAENLIITIFAQDRPGIVRRISDVVLEHKANWLQSSLSRLSGQFVGIAHIAVPPDHSQALLEALKSLRKEGIEIQARAGIGMDEDSNRAETISLTVEANDRPGIVEEITAALANHQINVEQMNTGCESASMAGYSLFRASLLVSLPQDLTVEQLEQVLDDVSDDLMTSIDD